MNERAERIAIWPPLQINPALAMILWEPVLGRKNMDILEYFDVFVDNFLGLSQGPIHQRRHVRHTLFQSLELLINPKDTVDTPSQK